MIRVMSMACVAGAESSGSPGLTTGGGAFAGTPGISAHVSLAACQASASIKSVLTAGGR